jgi:hypothetical protein
VIEHVCKGSKYLGFEFVDKNTKDSAANHHSGPAEILEGVLFIELRRCKADGIVIFFQIHNFLLDLK